MPTIASKFVDDCKEAEIDFVIGVPDGYLVPLIEAVKKDGTIPYIEAAREEECLGIASGLSMSGKRALVMIQNVGLLNSLGCFVTLCTNYRTPFLLLISHRGNIYDRNKYDVPKHRHWDNIISALNVFEVSWHAFRDEPNLIKSCTERAFVAGEPTLLLLDMPPEQQTSGSR